VWHKLRRQILDLPEVTVERLKHLNYLQHVINETLRLNPPVSNMTRIALSDTVLPTGGGPKGDAPVFVSKGTIISSAFFKLHRNKDVYGEDVDLWRPERWENLNISRLVWKFVPFGGGPHACPGQQLALNRVSFTLARLLKAFKGIESRDPVREFVPIYKLVTASQNGTKVALFT
jgi:cytochrome P450